MTGFQLIWGNRDGCHMWDRKCSTLSATSDFTPFAEFIISPIHYIYTLLNLSVLALCLRINDSGLFVCIRLTALSQTYLINTYISETRIIKLYIM